MNDITERVAKGAALLDDERPGWFNELHMESMRITQSDECVLGQLFGNYYTGRVVLFGADYRWDEETLPSSDYGFNLTTFEWDDYNYDEDTYNFPEKYWEAWNGEVSKRKNV